MMDGPEVDAWLKMEIEGLDQEIHQTDKGWEYDAFTSMYEQLPEIPAGLLLGSDVVIEYVDSDKKDFITPLYAHPNGLLARHIQDGGKRSTYPSFMFIRGSFLVDPLQEQKVGDEHVVKTLFSVLAGSQKVIGTSPKKDDDGTSFELHLAYSPQTICRDAYLITSKAYQKEEFLSGAMRARTLKKGLPGTLISAQIRHNTAEVFFVESSFTVGERVKNIHKRVGGEYTPLLSYVEPST